MPVSRRDVVCGMRPSNSGSMSSGIPLTAVLITGCRPPGLHEDERDAVRSLVCAVGRQDDEVATLTIPEAGMRNQSVARSSHP